MELTYFSLFAFVFGHMVCCSTKQGTMPWIVHTNLNTIQKLELDTWSNTTLVTGLSVAVSVDYHIKKAVLFWSDQQADRITRMSISNPNDKEDIAINGMDYADAIAVDWIYNHLYWVDRRHKHVKVSLLNGTLQKTLISTELETPRAIVVYPNIGWMFIADIYYAKIERSWLDGRNRQIIVSNKTTEIDDPSGLALDFSSNRLYWIDEIYKVLKTSNLDGTGIKTVASSLRYMPSGWGLALYRDWIFWTTFTNNTICRVDKQTGLNFQVVKSELSLPVGIKVYSYENQPTGVNLCAANNGGCEQLCLATPTSSIRCDCADGFKLKSDGKHCLNIGSGNWLTFANHYGVERLDMTTNVTETVIGGLVNAVDLDIHYEKGLVYWSDVASKKISRTLVTKDSVSRIAEDVITESVDVPDGIAVDWMYDLLYWTDTGHKHIQVSRLDGTYRRTILKDNSLAQPRAIVVDPTTGWLFFSDWGNRPRIERCRMDGAERRVIVDTDIVWPNGMSLDLRGQRLYWIDGSLNQIKSTRFDGSDTNTVLKNFYVLTKPFDLVVFDSSVYWTNWEFRSIWKVNKYTGKNLEIVANYVRRPMGIQVYGAEVQIKGENVCEQNNGGCSHLCFPLPVINTTKSTLSSCMCPDFYVMQPDQKTCVAVDPPTKILIDVAGSHVNISWTFTETTDIISETDLNVYDKDNNLTYSATVYAPTTAHAITSVQLKTCQLYKVKLSCKYSRQGWSRPIEVSFWPTDNLIHADLVNSINISWTRTSYRAHFDVAFSKVSDRSETGTTIYSNRILKQYPSKYTGLLTNGLHIQFTLNNIERRDVGLYKSMDNFNSTLIDGCALLVLTEKPLKPKLTYDRYPFVGHKTSFTCISDVKRLPSFVPYSLQYRWSLEYSQQSNVLDINPVAKSDKGKIVSCTAVDNIGHVSDSSETFILDPYYGPDDVRLSVLGESVNVTKGNKLGPITCTARCYPECNYAWRRTVSKINEDIVMGQNLIIDVALYNDSGTYTCLITHQNDSSRVRTISIELNVQNDSTEGQQTDNSKTGDQGMIIYPSITGGIVLIVISIVILRHWRLRRNPKHGTNRPDIKNPRNASSSLYDYIIDDDDLTCHMQLPDSNKYTGVIYQNLKLSPAESSRAYISFNTSSERQGVNQLITEENVRMSKDDNFY